MKVPTLPSYYGMWCFLRGLIVEEIIQKNAHIKSNPNNMESGKEETIMMSLLLLK
jgi:hypothetical protein